MYRKNDIFFIFLTRLQWRNSVFTNTLFSYVNICFKTFILFTDRRFVVNPLLLGKNGIMKICNRPFSQETSVPFVFVCHVVGSEREGKPCTSSSKVGRWKLPPGYVSILSRR